MNNIHLTRRAFLRAAAASAGGLILAGVPGRLFADTCEAPNCTFNTVKDPAAPTDLEKEHLINIRLPVIAEDGSNVPIVITMAHHPMQPDHYIKTLQIVNFNDPVVSKGLYHLSPANGQAHFSTQMRMDGGDVRVFVIAECSQHGKWVASKELKVSLGGC
ncbi:MAG: hypothetical protein HY784_09310 [Chloroflexi bacterium]|nr:hypothetical protein [Chloroflexota bacterium]